MRAEATGAASFVTVAVCAKALVEASTAVAQISSPIRFISFVPLACVAVPDCSASFLSRDLAHRLACPARDTSPNQRAMFLLNAKSPLILRGQMLPG